MPFSGSGVFSLYVPGNPTVTGTTISSTWANNTLSDIATGLTACLTKTGESTPTAPIKFFAGTVALPGITFANYPATGFYLIGANNWGWSSNGVKILDMGTVGISATTTIGVGAATPSSSGAGITFPASQSASSNANTLDDYEEGTWTLSLGGSATYTTRTGRYTMIGNTVIVTAAMIVNAIGTGSTNAIDGLPVATLSDGVGAVVYDTAASSLTQLVAQAAVTGLVFQGSTAAAAANTGATTIFGNGTSITTSLVYVR